MRRLLISAAALALLTLPNLTGVSQAQSSNDPSQIRGKGGFGQYQQRAQQQQREGNGGPTSFTDQAPPGANGQRPADRGNRGGRGEQTSPQVATPQGQQPQDRANRNWQGGGNRSYDNRSGPDNRRGFNNRSGLGNPGYGGPRRDFRNFRDYHRSFNASRRYRAPYYRRPAGWYDHRWSFGEYLPSAFWARDYWLNDYALYDLPPPPYGAVWVRVGSDALLVDEDSGEVITVAYGVFY